MKILKALLDICVKAVGISASFVACVYALTLLHSFYMQELYVFVNS